MEVILLEDVKNVGKKGDRVTLSDGYARNCIIKKKLGVEATAKNINDLKLQKANDEKLAAQRLEEAKQDLQFEGKDAEENDTTGISGKAQKKTLVGCIADVLANSFLPDIARKMPETTISLHVIAE